MPEIDGIDLAPALSGGNLPERILITEVRGSDGSTSYGTALRDERYKLINFDDGTQELYDLSVDPYEENDLLIDGRRNLLQPQRRALLDMEAALEAYQAELVDAAG